MDITVRNMETGDLRGAFLAARGDEGLPSFAGDCLPEEILADLYSEYPELCFTALLKKKVLGYIGGRLIESGEGRAARIVLFAVSEGPRGERAAGVLFERLRRACLEKGTGKIYSPVIPGNHPAGELYRKIGFSSGGTWTHFQYDSDCPLAESDPARK